MDLTVTSETAAGNVITYAAGDQVPITSAANFGANNTVTNYQVVPVSPSGAIDIKLFSSGTAQLIVDVTGYFDSVQAAGAQTYHPLATAERVLDTRKGLGASEGALAHGASITLQVAESGTANAASAILPANATAVAINLTATAETADGFLQAYAAGATAPASDTALSFGTSTVSSLGGDVPIGAGGKIIIADEGGDNASTQVIGDIAGYYTTDLTADVYHSTNPTRLADTRTGIGGSTGAVAALGTYTITASSVRDITTTASPALVLNLTAAQETASGDLIAYPYDATLPGTSNLNWAAGQTIANAALVPAGTGDEISVENASAGSTELIIDCSGFFASS